MADEGGDSKKKEPGRTRRAGRAVGDMAKRLEQNGRLVGAVTIDDVLDQVLPDNWRLALSESES